MLTIDLSERVVLVTGAAGGLGVPVCRCLLDAGARVVAGVRAGDDVSRLQALEAGAQLSVIETDVTDAGSVQALFEEIDALDAPLWGLVNIVGGYTGGPPIHETPPEDLERMFSLNVRSAFLCSREALSRFTAGERAGRVINISSAAAERGESGHFPYASTKAAVLRLTESAATEYRHLGVTVNAIQPGMIATPANLAGMPDADHSQWVRPEQIASTIAFLLSDLGSGVNGARLRLTARG